MTARDVARALPVVPNRTRYQFICALRRELRRLGIPFVQATYDAGGNCNVCGESGRCPNLHTAEELLKLAAAPATPP